MYGSPPLRHANLVPYPALIGPNGRPFASSPSYVGVAQTDFTYAPNQYRRPGRLPQFVGAPADAIQAVGPGSWQRQVQPLHGVVAQAYQPVQAYTQGAAANHGQVPYAQAGQSAPQDSPAWTDQLQSNPTSIHGVPSQYAQGGLQYSRAPLKPRTDPCQQPGFNHRPLQSEVALPASSLLSQENVHRASQQQKRHRAGDALEGWIHEPRVPGERNGLPMSPMPYTPDTHTPMSRRESIAESSTTGNSRRSKGEIKSAVSQFKCTACLAGFPASEALSHHMRNVHGVRAHICIECNRGFCYPGDLLRHGGDRHSDARPWKCEHPSCKYFGVGFKRKDGLKRHIRTCSEGRTTRTTAASSQTPG
ncbi:hypothetical protein LTR85_011842 [Meristemomyces frigidus]|nr:hypothetical protein LTR85_011842 [Meristemomyces frigidus]